MINAVDIQKIKKTVGSCQSKSTWVSRSTLAVEAVGIYFKVNLANFAGDWKNETNRLFASLAISLG